jgi:hypothetical protein
VPGKASLNSDSPVTRLGRYLLRIGNGYSRLVYKCWALSPVQVVDLQGTRIASSVCTVLMSHDLHLLTNPSSTCTHLDHSLGKYQNLHVEKGREFKTEKGDSIKEGL